MQRIIFYGVLVLVVSILAIAGFRGTRFSEPPIQIFDDMKQQAKYKAQSESSFYRDGRSDRAPVSGTVPVEARVDNTYLASGEIEGNYGNGLPLPVSLDLLTRGMERYNINCAPCHGAVGDGNGITSKYGLAGAANYHTDRLRNMPDGQIFKTIGLGKGNMLGLPHITVEDRWAIVAYVRVLQRSQHASEADVPEANKKELNP